MITRLEALDQIKSDFFKAFPLGFFSSGVIMGSLFFKVGLIADLNDCGNGIRDNDHMLSSFRLEVSDKGELIVEAVSGLSIKVLPLRPHDALGFIRFKFRKIKAREIEDLSKKWGKYLESSKQIVIEQRDMGKIYEQERIAKYLQF